MGSLKPAGPHEETLTQNKTNNNKKSMKNCKTDGQR